MSTVVNVNGEITDEQHAVVSVFDHGFLYGEGVYETMRTYGQRPFLLDRHLTRLRRSASLVALGVPLTDQDFTDRITQTIAQAAAGASDREWYVRLLVTRGVGDLTYDPAATPVPSVVVIVKALEVLPEAAYETGVRVIISSIVRNHPDAVNPAIKANNLMNNALAMQEAVRRGAFEAIMRNHRGEIAECSTANLFIVRDGAALTPPLKAGLLPGITRELVFEIGKSAGIPVGEATLVDDDLFASEELFLTSTTREILPIVDVDGRSIGSGRPGPLTRRLHSAYRRATASRIR
jgi:branched-chain amino acid aminotransferase